MMGGRGRDDRDRFRDSRRDDRRDYLRDTPQERDGSRAVSPHKARQCSMTISNGELAGRAAKLAEWKKRRLEEKADTPPGP
jgi:hypothetical protein